MSELQIHYVHGDRIHVTKHGQAVIILLARGDKSSQEQNTGLAKKLARNLQET